MRKLKLMSLLLVAVTLIGLASCSKDDNDNQETYYGVVKVEDNMGSIFFETQNGIKYYPTAASLLTVQQNYSFSATSGLAYIICTVTSSDDAAKTKNYETCRSHQPAEHYSSHNSRCSQRLYSTTAGCRY
jgi:hypothetical protein